MKVIEQSINCLGEFTDRNLEEKFHDSDVKKGLRLSSNIVLIFSIIHFMYFFLDYLYIKRVDTSVIINYSLFPRILILVLGIIVFVLLKMVKNKTIIKSAIVFAVLAYLVHIWMAIHFAPVNEMFEVLNLVIVTLCLFLIPNRWIANVCTSGLLLVVFIVMIPFTIPTLDIGTEVIVTTYLLIQLIVVSALIYQINRQRRLNYLQQMKLEILANTDTLTKAPNRAACDSQLHTMCADHLPFCIIIFDIDDFKRINDTYGHIVGDDVIVRMVDTVKTSIREGDIVSRWGGEEFIIILPRTTLGRATDIANRIRESIAEVKHDRVNEKVTASFGVTEYREGDDTRKLISRADQLLYLAKAYDKNRVVAG